MVLGTGEVKVTLYLPEMPRSIGTEPESQQTNDMSNGESFNSSLAKGMPFVEVNYDIYEPQDYGIQYKDVNGEAILCENLIKEGIHFILEGEKGLGKTLLVHDLCYGMGVPLVPVNCSASTTKEDLLGHIVVQKDGTFAFRKGALPIAVDIANNHPTKMCVIYADEPNTQTAEVQKIWNSLCDDRHSVVANDRIFKVAKGSKVIVIGAMNPLSYSGVNALNEDFVSRHCFYEVKIPSRETLRSVVDWKKLPEEDINTMLTLCESIRSLRNQGVVDYSISTRDMNQFATVYSLTIKNGYEHATAIFNAVKTCIIGKMPTEEQRESIKTLVYDAWGVNV